MDWHALWSFSSFHGVRPALAQVLDDPALAIPLPSWLTASLFQFTRQHAFAVLEKTSEIVRLAEALEAEQICAVFFKGAVLAEELYGGVAGREFNDIDLLVDPDSREHSADLLEAMGYAPVIAERTLRQAFFDYGGQHMFRHRETGAVVDLHWNFAGNLDFPADAQLVLANRIFLPLGGSPVPVPCSEDLGLILAGHGQKEGWASFGWALDFARFAARYPDFDWSQAADRARARGSSRSVLTAMLLIETLFGHVIDKSLLRQAHNQRSLVAEVQGIAAGYEALAERRLEDDLMGSFRLCETRWQKLKVWCDLLTTRTIGDFEAMPLPQRLWWLYRLTRPFRLGWQKLLRKPATHSAFFEAARKA